MAKVTNNFVPKNTAIEALNPMTKILAIFSLGLGSLIFPNSWLGIVIIIGLFFVAAMAKFVTIGERLSTTAPAVNKAFTERDPEPILKKSKTAARCRCYIPRCKYRTCRK